jgi:hypothetical protein
MTTEPYLEAAVSLVHTEVGGIVLETRCLLWDGRRTCWETAVTGGALDGIIKRYWTPREAERAHLWLLAEVLRTRWAGADPAMTPAEETP